MDRGRISLKPRAPFWESSYKEWCALDPQRSRYYVHTTQRARPTLCAVAYMPVQNEHHMYNL